MQLTFLWFVKREGGKSLSARNDCEHKTNVEPLKSGSESIMYELQYEAGCCNMYVRRTLLKLLSMLTPSTERTPHCRLVSLSWLAMLSQEGSMDCRTNSPRSGPALVNCFDGAPNANSLWINKLKAVMKASTLFDTILIGGELNTVRG